MFSPHGACGTSPACPSQHARCGNRCQTIRSNEPPEGRIAMNKLNWLPTLAVAVCATLVGAREPAVRLPDIGSSAAGIMSPTDQKDYGASMLHQMRAYNMVLDDPLINDYMHALGYRLVSFSDRPDLSFTF